MERHSNSCPYMGQRRPRMCGCVDGFVELCLSPWSHASIPFTRKVVFDAPHRSYHHHSDIEGPLLPSSNPRSMFSGVLPWRGRTFLHNRHNYATPIDSRPGNVIGEETPSSRLLGISGESISLASLVQRTKALGDRI
eukprot:scaffold24_cov341-Pavlova_lutheri.AAC.93